MKEPSAQLSENARYYWGVDCGSSEIKVVLCDASGNILHKKKGKTLFPLYQNVYNALNDGDATPFVENSPITKDNHKIIATGYGRHHLQFVDDKLTEIKAHFLGVQHQLKLDVPYTIIDIGGQDAKVITIDNSKVDEFAMNRKCAAGTGAFIEELAHRLEVPIGDMTKLANQHDKEFMLNSFCTVFSGQEVIKTLMNGERIENLIFALYRSVVKRVLEMTVVSTDIVAFSGGVIAHHPLLVELFGQKLSDKEMVLTPETQYCGALGAAVHGMSV
ncbi:MAG: ATPase [Chloracidobacterium sp.]|nr:ATPase [Chloracidobacterium sp.]